MTTNNTLNNGEVRERLCQTCRGKGTYAGLDITCRACHGSGVERTVSTVSPTGKPLLIGVHDSHTCVLGPDGGPCFQCAEVNEWEAERARAAANAAEIIKDECSKAAPCPRCEEADKREAKTATYEREMEAAQQKKLLTLIREELFSSLDNQRWDFHEGRRLGQGDEVLVITEALADDERFRFVEMVIEGVKERMGE